MAKSDVRVPSLGESVVEAVVGQWLKAPGDRVTPDDTLVELETDKVNLSVSADQAGILEQILKAEGETVAIGDVLAVVNSDVAAVPRATATPAPAAPESSVTVEPPQAAPAPSTPATDGLEAARSATVTPVAGRMAKTFEVDLAQVAPSGPGGRVTKDDVVSFLSNRERAAGAPVSAAVSPAPVPPVASTSAAAPAAAVGREERMRLSRRRQTIARRLVEAQHTAAMLTTFNEIDMSAVMDVRKRRKDSFKERHGVGLGFMSFFTKAVIGALKAVPRLNAEIQGDEIVLKRYYDIGIAVSADEGLVVPVVRDADRKTFAQIEREIGELAMKARANTLSLSDLQGGTFTVTNGGVFGSLLSTPILNGPQVGILGMHKIEERPIAVAGQVVVRPMMYVALSYDHRIVDGREAVQFLVRVKELVEDPESLLLEGLTASIRQDVDYHRIGIAAGYVPEHFITLVREISLES